METAKKFESLINAGKFEEAGELLADDFSWTAPNICLDKEGWLNEIPKRAKGATFEGFKQGTNGLQATRKGKRRIAFMNVSLIQTMEMTEDGKIKSIASARA